MKANLFMVMMIFFHHKKMPKEKATCKCLSIIMLDSVIKANKKYYPQTLLEECKYEQKRIKIKNLDDDDLEKSESDSEYNHKKESDNDNDNDKMTNKFKKKIFNNNKSIIVCVNNKLLDFYLCQSV